MEKCWSKGSESGTIGYMAISPDTKLSVCDFSP